MSQSLKPPGVFDQTTAAVAVPRAFSTSERTNAPQQKAVIRSAAFFADRPPYSSFTPVATTTGPHLACSDLMRAANSSGVLGEGVAL